MIIEKQDLQELRIADYTNSPVIFQCTRGFQMSSGLLDKLLPYEGYIYMNAPGTVEFIPKANTSSITLALPAGLFKMIVKEIVSTGTTATVTDICIIA